jgi:hypothetical protein
MHNKAHHDIIYLITIAMTHVSIYLITIAMTHVSSGVARINSLSSITKSVEDIIIRREKNQ